MYYAVLDGKKMEPAPRQKAKCPCCGGGVISRCGELNLWHWAHTNNKNCDNWYEPETQWHRNWKRIFGKNNSEIILMKDEVKHIADILTNDNIVIELQNSPISPETIRSREAFYGEKMIWIINADPFLLNFSISGIDPEYEITYPKNLFFSEDLLKSPGWFLDFEDIVVNDNFREFLYRYFKFIYKPDINKYFRIGIKDYVFPKLFIRKIKRFTKENLIEMPDPRLKYYTWSHPWKSWTEAKRPTFIDYDRDTLFFVKEGLGKRYGNGILVLKKSFISKYNR